MSKAILELDMPESCIQCPLYVITGICYILSFWNHSMPVYTPSVGRNTDCPLKKVEEDEEK